MNSSVSGWTMHANGSYVYSGVYDVRVDAEIKMSRLDRTQNVVLRYT